MTPDQVLTAVAAELSQLSERFGLRIRAAAVSVPGTVVGSRLVHAPNLGWHDVDLSVLWPRYDPDVPLIAGNDATFAAVAESRHGAGSGAGTMVYVHVEAGIGGAIVEGDRVVLGATGTAGEFGHMPFGDPRERCRCGAMGCWNTSVDGFALARARHEPPPADEVSYIRRVIAAARARVPEAAEAVQGVARSLGRGAAGLVNALDPHLIVLGGLGPEFLDVAAGHVTAAYHDGLMAFRSLPPPPLVPARLGEDGPLLGAAEQCFDQVLTDDGLQAWSAVGRPQAGAPGDPVIDPVLGHDPPAGRGLGPGRAGGLPGPPRHLDDRGPGRHRGAAGVEEGQSGPPDLVRLGYPGRPVGPEIP